MRMDSEDQSIVEAPAEVIAEVPEEEVAAEEVTAGGSPESALPAPVARVYNVETAECRNLKSADDCDDQLSS